MLKHTSILGRGLVLLSFVAVAVVPASVAAQSTGATCNEFAPTLDPAFQSLHDNLGDVMGDPTTCAFADPSGSGDLDQNTVNGLAYLRQSTNTPSFDSGFDHWALVDGVGLLYWNGPDVDPPADAQVVPPPTAAVPPPPQPQPQAGGPGRPTLMVSVQSLSQTAPLLRPGDDVFVFSMRDTNGTPITAQSPKFQRQTNAIESSPIPPGVNKMLVLSTLDDLNSVASHIPADITWIAYNTEGGITPQSELASQTTFVPQFASVVHGMGKKMMWAPSRDVYNQYANGGSLNTILPSTDALIFQAQRLLPNEDINRFQQDVQHTYQTVKGISPNTQFALQLWIGTQGATPSQLVNAFNPLNNFMDICVVGTVNDPTSAAQVIQGLTWRQQ